MRVAHAVASGAHVRVLGGASVASGDFVGAFLEPEDEEAEDGHEDQCGSGGAVGGVALVDGDVDGFGVEAEFWDGGCAGDVEGDVLVGLVEVADHAADEADFEEAVYGEKDEEDGKEEVVLGG